MKPTDSPRPALSTTPGRSPLPLAVIFFILGAALAGWWFHRAAPAPPTGRPAGELFWSTQKILSNLAAPVTIRYYSLLPADSTDAYLTGFAARVGALLEVMETASGGRLLVETIDTPAETNATAAGAAGLKVFNLEKGEASYLGLTLTSGRHQEIFERLLPEWEPALESDLARALLRVAVPEMAAAPVPLAESQPSPEVVATINRLIPDISNTTVETADQIFHAEFMKEIGDAGTEMEAQMTAAQQLVDQAKASGSAADLEAAQKNLAQVQAAQGEKIRQIATSLKTRLAVFKQMKDAAAK